LIPGVRQNSSKTECGGAESQPQQSCRRKGLQNRHDFRHCGRCRGWLSAPPRSNQGESGGLTLETKHWRLKFGISLDAWSFSSRPTDTSVRASSYAHGMVWGVSRGQAESEASSLES